MTKTRRDASVCALLQARKQEIPQSRWPRLRLQPSKWGGKRRRQLQPRSGWQSSLPLPSARRWALDKENKAPIPG